MAWTQADGSPITMTPISIQIEVPSGQTTSIGTPNWGAIMGAVIQLVIAMMTGNPTAIAAAIQALINAFVGK